jgi:hypothetical protein
MNLMAQVGILSLANQGLIGTLAIEDIRKFLDLYLHLPAWVFLFVPPIQVGKSLVRQLL